MTLAELLIYSDLHDNENKFSLNPMNLWQDIRYAARMLRKSPGFAVTAVFTLAVGIGVTSAIYSICDAMLWKPVALPELETLVMVLERDPGGGADNWNVLTPADLEDIRRATTALENIACWQGGLASIVGSDGQPEGVLQTLVSANFFDAVRVKPVLGRAFETGEDQPGREREVILSDRIWKNRFGADAGIIGKTLRLDSQNFVVIGVMPDSFDFPLGTEIWTPNALTPADRSSRRSNMLTALARLKPGHTVERAEAELDSIGTRLQQSYPDTNKNRRFMIRPAHWFLVNYQREQYLVMVLGSALFVLVIACVNVANLQFARVPSRLHEVAVRTAVGASPWRVISQLVTESTMLSMAGAALGLILATWAMNMIKAGMPPELVRFVHGWNDIQLDHRVLAFTLVAAVLSGILAGIAPAWQCSRPNLTDALKEGGRGGCAAASRRVLRNILVAAEITLAVVLLVGAGLMVRGFRAQVDAGAELEPATLLTLRLAIPGNKYREPHQVSGFYHDVLNRISALSGVRNAAAVTALPYSGHSTSRMFTIEGRPLEHDEMPAGMYQAASPSYFETVHIPLLEGRLLSESDGPDTPKVALISEHMAARWWKNESPLGQHIRIGGRDSESPRLTIVGVVGDVIHSPYDREPRPTFYVPYVQAPEVWMDIGVRTTGADSLLLAPDVMAAIRDVDREQPVTDMRTMEKSIRNSAIGLNYMAVLMGIFGLLALGLSAIGVHGVIAQSVSEQTREIGIRMALGAQRQSVLATIFRRGILPVAGGLMFGLPLAWGFSRFLASVIYGVTASDAATFVGVPVMLILASALAIYIPARRATRINPIVALRHE
jgi:putative ABC transport system permease protein